MTLEIGKIRDLKEDRGVNEKQNEDSYRELTSSVESSTKKGDFNSCQTEMYNLMRQHQIVPTETEDLASARNLTDNSLSDFIMNHDYAKMTK